MDGYFRSGLTGGTASDLDGVSDASLTGGEVAWVYESETLYQYVFDATSTDAEASPTRIRPDDYDTGVWHLVSLYNGVMPVMASGVEAEGGISGLNLSLDTDTEHDVNVSIGSCKDSANQVDIILSTTITKRIDATWVEGDDNGGLLNNGALGGGVIANTIYHVYIIKDSSGTVDVAFLEDGDTLATRLSGISYTYYRWIGFVVTDASSNIEPFRNFGTHYDFYEGITVGTSGAIDVSSWVPSSRATRFWVHVDGNPTVRQNLSSANFSAAGQEVGHGYDGGGGTSGHGHSGGYRCYINVGTSTKLVSAEVIR